MRPSSFNSGGLSRALGPTFIALAPACFAIAACGLAPSRAPLGGNYALPEAASAQPRRAHADTASATTEGTGTDEDAPPKHAHVVTTPATVGPGSVVESADTVRYEQFKTGDQIRADVSFGIAAEIQGGSSDLHGSDNKLVLDVKLHVEVKVLKSSAQSLDELEVTLTPVSMHTDFDGQSSDSKQDPAETYDITLSGQAPSIRAKGGASLEKEDRATLLVLLTPLVEFHNHWARSPSLALKPGWSSKVPLTAPAFMASPGDKVHVGPLSVRYGGRDAGATNVPFDLNLPIEWTTDFGLLNFDFSGRAQLGAKGRPVSLDLNGPLTGNAGPAGSQFALRGTAKFVATLSYP